MNNKILKTSAVLALGTLLLVPTTKDVYATSTNTEANQSVKSNEEKYKEVIDKLNSEIEKSYAYMDSYQYKNSDSDYQIEFNNAVLGLEKAYKEYKDFTPKSADDYEFYIDHINKFINIANNAKNKLNGREVDKTEIFTLINEKFSFQGQDAYKNAPEELKKEYEDAIKKSYNVLSDSQDNLTNVENEEIVKAVKEAKNKIISHEETRKARLALKEEIALISDIKADKALYTEKSYNSYNNAAILAKSTIENPSSTLDQIKSATDLLASARKNLAKKQTASDISREDQIKRLEDAIKANKETKAAANLLKEITPNFAQQNMEKLNNLIKKSDEIVARSTKVLNQLKGIRG